MYSFRLNVLYFQTTVELMTFIAHLFSIPRMVDKRTFPLLWDTLNKLNTPHLPLQKVSSEKKSSYNEIFKSLTPKWLLIHIFTVACLCVRKLGFSHRWSDYFWLFRPLFPLDCKFFTVTAKYTNTHTHISSPHSMSSDVSTQESVLWTGLICGRRPLRLILWFKVKLWSFIFLLFLSLLSFVSLSFSSSPIHILTSSRLPFLST